MKAWVARVERPNQTGWFGNVFESFIDAVRWADANAGASIVQVELPDPPHVWKVGDWFTFDDGENYSGERRIVDIDPHGAWSLTWRRNHGQNTCSGYAMFGSPIQATAIPCDPPSWFTEDGAS